MDRSEIDFVNLRSDCSKKIALPEPKGPHQIGTVTYAWIDPNSEEKATSDSNDLRQVIAQIFYPGKRVRDTAPTAYVPELEFIRAGLKADKREMPNKIADDLALYGCVVAHYPNATRWLKLVREQDGLAFSAFRPPRFGNSKIFEVQPD